MKNNSLIFVLTLTLISLAQENYFIREIMPFDVGNTAGLFDNTFSGGLNNPEFQFVDIDADDDFDLFILNSDGSFELFQNKGNKFSPSFEFSNIPAGLQFYDWFYFVDIDGDDDYDFFTGLKGSKVKYYENIGSIFSPAFQLQIDTVRNINGNDLNVETGSNPAFVDIDTDGDYDLICGNTSGTANYYENIGTPFQFVFDSLDSQWQDLRVGLGKVNHIQHGASSIDFVDIDKDNDPDLFWGDFFNTSLYLIRNIGTPEQPQMRIETRVFPSGDSVTAKGFNMPRFVDIDGDNEFDLFTSILWNDITTKNTISLRRNNGANNFEFITDNYLNLLDVGSRSIPDFVDIDADNDLDLFIGSESLTDGTIYYFENIGTPSNPNFILVDSNYFGISGELSLSPTFGDLDADGDYDLLVGNYFNDIIFYENTGDRFTAFFENKGILKNSINENIKAGIYSRIRLNDVDLDGDLDIVVGDFNGQVLLYRNIGTSVTYNFEIDEAYFNIEKPGNYTNPICFDYDSDGINELFVGTDAGKILLYENGNNLSPSFVLADDNFLNASFGKEPNLFFSDIENDGDKDIIIGNIKGGLYFYRNNIISSVIDKPLVNNLNISLKSYPNPFNGSVQIEIGVPDNLYFSLKIFNILGEEVALLYNGISKGETQKFVWDTSNISNGISSGTYIISIQAEGNRKNLPVLFLK